jgi:hypothetical protein
LARASVNLESLVAGIFFSVALYVSWRMPPQLSTTRFSASIVLNTEYGDVTTCRSLGRLLMGISFITVPSPPTDLIWFFLLLFLKTDFCPFH